MHRERPIYLLPEEDTTDFPEASMGPSATLERRPSDPPHVGSVLRRRIRYIARFVYWTLRHGHTRNVRWVLAHEGTQW